MSAGQLPDHSQMSAVTQLLGRCCNFWIGMQAMSNMLRRMLEASGRGMWNANSETLQRLQQMYGNLQDKLEGV